MMKLWRESIKEKGSGQDYIWMRENMIPLTIEISDMARSIVELVIYTVFFMFTLPLRCCTFTNLYAALDVAAIGSNSQSDDSEGKD